mmetsp:Transcript_50079/g.154738  ORF Transcript_50079/g.154738 Transcript_50079/m.154738 type:complete len:223 (+) Transcript_50079:313-981(+)
MRSLPSALPTPARLAGTASACRRPQRSARCTSAPPRRRSRRSASRTTRRGATGRRLTGRARPPERAHLRPWPARPATERRALRRRLRRPRMPMGRRMRPSHRRATTTSSRGLTSAAASQRLASSRTRRRRPCSRRGCRSSRWASSSTCRGRPRRVTSSPLPHASTRAGQRRIPPGRARRRPPWKNGTWTRPRSSTRPPSLTTAMTMATLRSSSRRQRELRDQ